MHCANELGFQLKQLFCEKKLISVRDNVERYWTWAWPKLKGFQRDRRKKHKHTSLPYYLLPLSVLIVTITKFSTVIGSTRAYLSRNRRAITWVSEYSCPIWTFWNRTPVIGYPRDFHVNYVRFNGFLSIVFYSYGRFRSKEVLRRHV